MTMTILQLSAVLRTTNLWLFLKKKTKISNLRGHTASQKMAVAWPKTKKQNLNLEEQNEKQNKIKLKNKIA